MTSGVQVSELEAEVLTCVEVGVGRIWDICRKVIRRYSDVDRALQKLRRKGLIAYTQANGWRATS